MRLLLSLCVCLLMAAQVSTLQNSFCITDGATTINLTTFRLTTLSITTFSLTTLCKARLTLSLVLLW
jgi:hypothetical protein